MRGEVLEPSARRARRRRARARWSATSRCRRRRSIVTSGGIGGNHDLVRAQLAGAARARRRRHMISGVPDHVDGRMLGDHRRTPAAASSTPTACGTTSRASRTGTRSGAATASASCPGRRRCGSTRAGKRLPVPLFPGFDTLGHARAHHARPATTTPGSCSPRRSSSRSSRCRAPSRTPTSPASSMRAGPRTRVGAGRARAGRGVQGAGRRLRRRARPAPTSCAGMNALDRRRRCSTCAAVEREIVARDREIDNPYTKDAQVTAIRGARSYLGDRLIRVADAAPPARPRRRPADRRAALHPHPQDARRAADRPLRPRAAGRRRAAARALRRRRGRRLRRRRHARLPRAGGHVPRRLPVLGPRPPAGRRRPRWPEPPRYPFRYPHTPAASLSGAPPAWDRGRSPH